MVKGIYFKIRSFIKNYDLAYISKKINILKESNIDTLIVGLSYSLFGIKEELLKSTVNLSLPSQDIFYGYIITKKISEFKKLNKVIIGLSYYSLYFDLSKSKKEKIRIDNVYYPLLRNTHNYKRESSILSNVSRVFKRTIYNKVYINIISSLVNENYFNYRNTREKFVGIKDFNKLNCKEKTEIGKQRAEMHNKLFYYEDTRIENENILREFIQNLIEKNIEPVIVIFPCTKYYKNILNNEFKKVFYKCFDKFEEKSKIKIIDLYNSNEFNDGDFADADHLNENGSIKVSKILNKL